VRTIAAGVAAAVLAGCASLYTLQTEVSSYSRWPAGRTPASYAFERLPSQQARPQQAQQFEDAARPAIEAAGFTPVLEGSVADVTVQVGARITATDLSPFADPFWYGGRVWHRPFLYRRYGGPIWGPGWRHGFWDPSFDFPDYEREVALLIRDKRSGDPLYEARATSEGTSAAVTTILPAMYFAAMRDFPAGSTSNPHPVGVELPH
jgi:uncharacterized protein DUF4136